MSLYRRLQQQADGVTIAAGAAIVIFALLSLALPRFPVPSLVLFGPVAFFVAVVNEWATAIVTLATWRYTPARTSAVVLALSFAAGGSLTWCATLLLPVVPSLAPVIGGFVLPGMWIYVGSHALLGAGGLAYAMLRRATQRTEASRRQIRRAAFVLALASTVAVGVCAFAYGRTSSPSDAAIATIVVLTLAAFTIFRIRKSTSIDRAFALSLMAFAADLALLIVDDGRFTPIYYSGRVLLACGASFGILFTIQALLRSRTQLYHVEGKLATVEGESQKRAGRIRALWQITTRPEQSQEQRFTQILETATASIRPGHAMFGILCHLEDDTVVVDATSWENKRHAYPAIENMMYPGARIPLERSMMRFLTDADRTIAWNDLSAYGNAGMLYQDLDLHGLIGTSITIGRRTHFISFASAEAMTGDPFTDDDSTYVDVVASFFATRFSLELQFERIQFQVEHDALTGLKNRAQFRNALRGAISSGDAFAVAFLNLDHFRAINERNGHMIGDEILVEVAAELRSIAPGDFVARMDGDEFGLLLRNAEPAGSAEARLGVYAERFQRPFHTGDRNGTFYLHVGASIGGACFPDHGLSAEDLMRRADVALSVAKDRGGSATFVFDESMESLLEASHMQMAELTAAIAGDQLALVYQPTFDLATRTVIGAEALVRWDHPVRGRLSPAEFLPAALRSGLIKPLTQWVFRRLVRDLLSWGSLPPGFRAYFNIGADALDDFAFVAEINETLRASPGLAAHIGIELTETAAMQDVERAMHTIDLFRRWGMYVAIDDFGTGYSSLSYLKQLSVDVIKIDRSFVMDLPHDERGGAITDMLLRITDQFGLATLAEGIETEAQATWLLEHGCRFGQGYLIARPDEFHHLIERVEATHSVA